MRTPGGGGRGAGGQNAVIFNVKSGGAHSYHGNLKGRSRCLKISISKNTLSVCASARTQKFQRGYVSLNCVYFMVPLLVFHCVVFCACSEFHQAFQTVTSPTPSLQRQSEQICPKRRNKDRKLQSVKTYKTGVKT